MAVIFLEVETTALVVYAIGSYAVWWQKPQGYTFLFVINNKNTNLVYLFKLLLPRDPRIFTHSSRLNSIIEDIFKVKNN